MRKTVKDVMTRTVVVVRDSTPFKEVVRRMQEHRVSAVPVVDEYGRCLGIVSEADLILKEDPRLEGEARLFEGRRHRHEREKHAAATAAALMSTPPITVGPEATLAEAARQMGAQSWQVLRVARWCLWPSATSFAQCVAHSSQIRAQSSHAFAHSRDCLEWSPPAG